LETTPAALALALCYGGCSTFDPSFGYLASGGGATTGGEGGAGGSGTVLFGRDLRPIIARGPDDPSHYGCKQCHYSSEPSHVGYDLGGLDLSTLGALRRGGATSGTRIVVAGDPDSSVIVQKLRGTYPFGARMPRKGAKWGDDEMALMTTWIAEGAPGADDE
jgi:hypothetical protein